MTRACASSAAAGALCLLLSASAASLPAAAAPPPPACEWTGALPNAYVGSALGAASFATAAGAIAACDAAANCTGVTSQQRGAPPWGLRVGQVQGGTPGTGSVVSFAMTNAVACGHVALPLQVGFHNASFDAAGNLLPPAAFNFSVQRAMDASVAYYAAAPQSLFSHGFPPWVWSTFLLG